jgi:hypothetical protein
VTAVTALGLGAQATLAGCGGAPADTATVLLTEGRAGSQPWRLEGRRAHGQPCVSLVLPGVDRPPEDRCGVMRNGLRQLEPDTVTVDGRLLVFSPLTGRARRVRLDELDGTIMVEPARQASGFPARFFLVDLEPAHKPLAVRVFGEGGRAVVT